MSTEIEEKKQKRREITKKYREKNKERLKQKSKEYRQKNKEKVKSSNENWIKNNKNRVLEKAKRYRDKNPDKIKKLWNDYYKNNKEKVKENSLIRKYKINIEQYKKMLEQQDNRCYLCQTVSSETKSGYLVVDHCHKTGNIRKLLCNPCNTALGLLKENVEVLEKAIKYLSEFHPTNGSSDEQLTSD